MSTTADIAILLDTEKSLDEKLPVIEKLTISRMLNIMPPKPDGTRYTEVPAELGYIITNIVMARYVRLGNEGLTQFSQDGLQLVFRNDDFDNYMNEITSFGDDGSDTGMGVRGRVLKVF